MKNFYQIQDRRLNATLDARRAAWADGLVNRVIFARRTMVDIPCECGEPVSPDNAKKHVGHRLAE